MPTEDTPKILDFGVLLDSDKINDWDAVGMIDKRAEAYIVLQCTCDETFLETDAGSSIQCPECGALLAFELVTKVDAVDGGGDDQ